jgi:hypothetical protein
VFPLGDFSIHSICSIQKREWSRCTQRRNLQRSTDRIPQDACAFLFSNGSRVSNFLTIHRTTLNDFLKDHSDAAYEIYETNKEITIAKIDGPANPISKKFYKAVDFPTFIYFSNEEYYQFDGEHTKQGIVDWVNQRLLLKERKLETEEELNKEIETNHANVLTSFNR